MNFIWTHFEFSRIFSSFLSLGNESDMSQSKITWDPKWTQTAFKKKVFFHLTKIFLNIREIYRFRHNEITVYIVGIILTFMTYYLYFTGTGIICQVNISQRADWSATSHTHVNTVDQRKWYFSWYPISYYTVSLCTFFGNWLR